MPSAGDACGSDAESADKTVAAVSVITAARPVAVVGKMLEHQVEQLHRLGDLGFRHWFERSRSGVRVNPITGRRNPHRCAAHVKAIGDALGGRLIAP